MKHITLCGSFGFGNAGDEALPMAIQDIAQERDIDANISILGRFNQPALDNVIGLSESYALQIEKLRNSTMLVTGGGAIESTQSGVVSRCSKYLNRNFASSISLYGANVEYGVRYSFFHKYKIKNILNEFEYYYVRDVLSYKALEQIIPKKNIKVIGDPVLWLKPSSEIPELINSLDKYIVIILASHTGWEQDRQFINWIVNQLSQLSLELNSSILFLPFSIKYDDDICFHKKIANEINKINKNIHCVCWENEQTPRQLLGIISKSVLTVSMRLHGCVMSYSQKVPFIPLTYHPKVTGFVKTIECEEFYKGQVLAKKQTRNKYGYSFKNTNLETTSLLSCALQIIENNDFFHKLDELKSSCVEAFSIICS